MAIFQAGTKRRSRRTTKPVVTIHRSRAEVEALRPEMRTRSLYLASVSSLPDGSARAVWAPGRHHEITGP